MKRSLLPFFAIAILLAACQNELDESIHSAAKDGMISLEEWNDIEHEALSAKKYIGENGAVDVTQLQAYIKEYTGQKLRGVEIAFSEEIAQQLISMQDDTGTIVFKFYLERSGSMIPYDDKQTTGQFKSAITGLLNTVPNNRDTHNLMFVVNNQVTPFRKTFKDFVQSSNIMEDTKGYGDARYTEYTCIFDSVLNRTGDNEVSILVSDMIYSTKHQDKNIQAQRLMGEAVALTNNIFSGHGDKDILIIKLNADYNGRYYPYNSPNVGFLYRGMRPYYMMIVAKSDLMHQLFNDSKYSDFCNFKHLDGYENHYCFTRKCDNPEYSILFKNSSRFAPEKGQKQIHSIRKLTSDRLTGETKLTVAVDMSGIITESEYLINTNNYQVQSKSGFTVTNISQINETPTPPYISHYLPTATHLIELTTSGTIVNETVYISLKNEFPSWIAKSTTKDDRDKNDPYFPTTTFAFKSMMDGIYQAFYSTSNLPVYYSLTINIKK